MDLSNFSKALSPLATKDFTDVVIGPNLTFKIVAIDAANRQFTQRQKEFIKSNPEHTVAKDNQSFIDDLWDYKQCDAVISYLIGVVIQDWQLTDDNGKSVEYTEKLCAELLNDDRVGQKIIRKIVSTSLDAKQFQDNWENYITKNS